MTRFIKSGPAITVHTPTNWVDWTLATISAVAIGIVVCLWFFPVDPSITVDMGETSITMHKSDAVKACEQLAESAFVAQLGGMKADSPCGELLGL